MIIKFKLMTFSLHDLTSEIHILFLFSFEVCRVGSFLWRVGGGLSVQNAGDYVNTGLPESE